MERINIVVNSKVRTVYTTDILALIEKYLSMGYIILRSHNELRLISPPENPIDDMMKKGMFADDIDDINVMSDVE